MRTQASNARSDIHRAITIERRYSRKRVQLFWIQN
jgi:hypothetical protein